MPSRNELKDVLFVILDACLLILGLIHTFFQPGFEQMSKYVLRLKWKKDHSFTHFKKRWCLSFQIPIVKHPRPTTCIKEQGSGRQLGALCCRTSACSPTRLAPLFSGSNECAPPCLAKKRSMDIFPMTRGTRALK